MTFARVGFALMIGFGILAVVQPQFMPQADAPYDKVLHATIFGTVTLFGVFSTRNFDTAMVIASLIVIAGMGVEIVQAFIPGRSAGILDALANMSGAIVVIVVYYFFGNHSEKGHIQQIKMDVINAYQVEKRLGASHLECLDVAAQCYRAFDPAATEQEVRQKVIQWVDS